MTYYVRLWQTFMIAQFELTVVNALKKLKTFRQCSCACFDGPVTSAWGETFEKVDGWGRKSPSEVSITMWNFSLTAGRGWLGIFFWRSVYDTVRRRAVSPQTRTLQIRMVLFWYYNDKQTSNLHLLSEVGVPETSQEVRTMLLLCLPNRTLRLLYPWEVGNKCLRNLYT